MHIFRLTAKGRSDHFMQDMRREKLRVIFTSKQFYIALALCVAIAGIGIYYANGLKQIEKLTSQPTTQGYTKGEEPLSGMDVVGDIPGMPDNRSKESETSPPQTTQAAPAAEKSAAGAEPQTEAVAAAPSVFSLPLGTDIGLDFSRDEMVFNNTMGDWRIHNGVDFKGAVGDTVKAVAAGKVLAVYDDALWGTVMEIDHGGGIVAKYCGLGRGSTLDEGAVVKMNDTIGNLGTIPAEGNEDIHLHFEIRVNGEVADPLEVMGMYGEDMG